MYVYGLVTLRVVINVLGMFVSVYAVLFCHCRFGTFSQSHYIYSGGKGQKVVMPARCQPAFSANATEC